eukprot:scaffold311917_cov17-Tisochrysis_lutea.AAC.1
MGPLAVADLDERGAKGVLQHGIQWLFFKLGSSLLGGASPALNKNQEQSCDPRADEYPCMFPEQRALGSCNGAAHQQCSRAALAFVHHACHVSEARRHHACHVSEARRHACTTCLTVPMKIWDAREEASARDWQACISLCLPCLQVATQGVRLTCHTHQQDENTLSFSMSFVNHRGAGDSEKEEFLRKELLQP